MPEKSANVLVSRVYLRDSLLIDMSADETTQRSTGSIRTDQSGKVFAIVGQDVRRCLICEGVLTRQASAEHAKVACYPPAGG